MKKIGDHLGAVRSFGNQFGDGDRFGGCTGPRRVRSIVSEKHPVNSSVTSIRGDGGYSSQHLEF